MLATLLVMEVMTTIMVVTEPIAGAACGRDLTGGTFLDPGLTTSAGAASGLGLGGDTILDPGLITTSGAVSGLD